MWSPRSRGRNPVLMREATWAREEKKSTPGLSLLAVGEDYLIFCFLLLRGEYLLLIQTCGFERAVQTTK